MKPARVLLLSCLAALAPQGGDEVKCRKCDSTGRQPCPEHPRDECALEDEVLFCSEVFACASCRGAGFVDCAKCENPATERRLAERREEAAAGRERWKSLDDVMGRPVLAVETEHFVLVFEVDSLKVEKRRLRGHALRHVYARRLEELQRLFVETLHVREGELKSQMQVFVWGNEEDQLVGSLKFCRQTGSGGVRLHGWEPRYSVSGGRNMFPRDEDLHRNLAHNVSQVLFSHQTPSEWIGNKKAGWAEEGLAHWFEDRLFGRCDNYCFEEMDTGAGFRGGKFKPMTRKLVARDSQPSVGQILHRNTDDFTSDMHPVAMSYVDFLLDVDAEKFSELGRRLRGGAASRDALQEVFGWTPIAFEERWKEWVLETYPTR